MIKQTQSLLYRNQSCHEVVQWVTEQLILDGLQVIQTFGFDGADQTGPCGCGDAASCQHYHGGPCDCQLVVLFVYGRDSQPVSLIAQGYDGKTWLNLVENFSASSQTLEAQVRRLLGSEI